MVETYDPVEFWQATDLPAARFGPWDPAHPADLSPEHARQEDKLRRIIENQVSARLRTQAYPRTIFEAGCGYGRLARFFAIYFPGSEYHAIDLGEAQLSSASAFQPNGHFAQADLLTYDVNALYDNSGFEGYDLVIASEVLMHIKPADVRLATTQLLNLANPKTGSVVTIDWYPTQAELLDLRRRGQGAIAPWNFPHDYPRLFREAGAVIHASTRTDRQKIFVLR